VKQIIKESVNTDKVIKIKREKTQWMGQIRTHDTDIPAGLEQARADNIRELINCAQLSQDSITGTWWWW
jgi:predicted nucleic acid-binding Zn ribbon protein